MRKFILIFLFLNFYLVAYNQVIKGTILDQKTLDKINFAYIYFNGTSVGTNSDQNGNFELDISKNASMPLTISALGYYSVTLTDLSAANPVLVHMKPKVFELNDVVIKGKSLARRRQLNLNLFREAILGTTANAEECEIINENDIKFNYDSDTDTLKAFASKPIIINNRALGYTITFFLDKFELDKTRFKTFNFLGGIIFKENLTVDESKKQLYKANRKEAYLGSKMHFFRALWENNLFYSGFIIEDSHTHNPLSYNTIIFQKDFFTKVLKYKGELNIYYNYIVPPNNLYLYKGEVSFKKNGYIDPLDVIWGSEGQMGRQRIADWLPYEYSIN
jgi:hypothetical protein